MTTDFRALCAELLAWAERTSAHYVVPPHVIIRARAALSAPEQGPTEAEVADLAEDLEYQRLPRDTSTGPSFLLEFARAVLARWSRPAVEPVPVAERLPGPEDCTINPRTGSGQWCWGWVQHDPLLYSGRWRMMRRDFLADEAKAWLPHWALPVPQEGADG
jgi:hypothetical protein